MYLRTKQDLLYFNVYFSFPVLPMLSVDEVFPIRLVGGTNDHEGRVEINRAGEWGTICGNDFDSMDAGVICRELGFPNAMMVYTDATTYGEGTGAIWLDMLDCNGTEYAIEDCPNPGLGVHTCDHSMDVGVMCDGECECCFV